MADGSAPTALNLVEALATISAIKSDTSSLAVLAPEVAGFIGQVTQQATQNGYAIGMMQGQLDNLTKQFGIVLQLLQSIIMGMATASEQQQTFHLLQEILTALRPDAPRTIGLDPGAVATQPQPSPPHAGPLPTSDPPVHVGLDVQHTATRRQTTPQRPGP